VSAQPQKEVKAQIDSLIGYIRLKGTEAFAEQTVYNGENASRKWKDVYDPSKPEELRSAKEMMQKLKKALDGCNYKEFDVFKESRQSEGTWYVYTYACGNTAKIHLSFLKIKGKYALGDVDVEVDEE
jgi:hypothetical protein